jgi:hypothetical protein
MMDQGDLTATNQGDRSAFDEQPVRWRQRLRGIGNGARAPWRRFRWRSEDTLALLITALPVVVIFLVLLLP